MTNPFSFDGRWVFPVPPEALWSVLCRTDRFRQWWPWLRALDSEGLVEGTESRCVVRAPVPYSLRFRVSIEKVEPHRLVTAQVRGDVEGPARLEVAPHAQGSEASLWWELQLRDPLLRVGARAARPLMEWGHDWVVATGVRQFRRRALGLG